MNDRRDEVKKATRLLQEREYELLTALGLKSGEEPNDTQRVEILGKLNEAARQHLSPALLAAMQIVQQRAGNYPHPIDALEVALVSDMEPQERVFWEATRQQHVMKVKRPSLRD